MVKKKTIRLFYKRGGYEALKESVTKASEVTGLSRPTIYGILEKYPTKESVTRPKLKYVEKFRESEGYKLWKQEMRDHSKYKIMTSHIVKAFSFIGNTDPIGWGREQFAQIWSPDSPFWSEELGGVHEHYATTFHHLMRVIERPELNNIFKGKKYDAGKKLNWYLHTEDIEKLVKEIEREDVLIYTLKGIVTGGRHSSIIRSKYKMFDLKDGVVRDREPKISKTLLRFLPQPSLLLFARYFKDFDFNSKPNEYIFQPKLDRDTAYEYFNDALKEAGERAGLDKIVTTHILKHTFVTQASKHGVSAEVIKEQVHTELRTLDKYYRAKDERKIRHELLGEEYDVMPMDEWFEHISGIFQNRYDQLRG